MLTGRHLGGIFLALVDEEYSRAMGVIDSVTTGEGDTLSKLLTLAEHFTRKAFPQSGKYASAGWAPVDAMAFKSGWRMSIRSLRTLIAVADHGGAAGVVVRAGRVGLTVRRVGCP